ncbi:MAG: hypothetical protein Ct9H90mP16_03400 [Candidatus Poseidoniales archaeon]|nr:MAG: hypothetical protein Ct9H90mP16_03400 [Candidatus Poseidoniales archaeon]
MAPLPTQFSLFIIHFFPSLLGLTRTYATPSATGPDLRPRYNPSSRARARGWRSPPNSPNRCQSAL